MEVGHNRWKIIAAAGAKALPAFASGSLTSEAEVTTLPGARFLMIDKPVKNEYGGLDMTVIMLPPHEASLTSNKKVFGA
jgi:hypothetical protein